jgi:predicted nucleic acid-binding protein
MDVILDTNIYQNNFTLKSNSMDALSAYLKKTDDRLIVPYIVAQELLRNYKSTFEKSVDNIEKASRLFHSCITTEEQKKISDALRALERYKEDGLANDSTKYLEYLKSTLTNVVVQDTMPPLDFSNVVKKGLDKTKPFKITGEGMKDAILWESILEHCSHNQLGRIIFISNNANDFGKDNALEPNLIDQMKESGTEVVYYNGLQPFIENEFDTVSDINLKSGRYRCGRIEKFT